MTAGVTLSVHPDVTRYLLPGEWTTGGPGDVMSTLLGSCVAMVLWEPRMRLGAMCHFVLPTGVPGGMAHPDGRFANVAFMSMQRELSRRGVTLQRCTLRIYGGANTYETGPGDVVDIGRRNIRRARALADEAGLGVVEEHTGGLGWWRLRVDFATGEAQCQFNPLPANALVLEAPSP